MGIVIRQGVKSSIATYLGVVIGAFNLLWLFPKFLSTEEIGLTRVILDTALILAALSQLGATSITDRFFSFFKDKENKHKGFFLLLLVYPLVGFLLTSLIFLAFKDVWVKAYQDRGSSLLLDYFYEIIPLAFFIMYMTVLEAYARVHFRIVVPSLVREVFLRVFLAGTVVLYYLKFIRLDDLVILIIVSYMLAAALLLGYIKKLNVLFFTSKDTFQDKKLLKEMVIFGLFIFLGSASGLIATKIDVIMLSAIKDLDNAGIYSVAFFMGTVIEIPRRAISQISTPLIAQAWKNNDLKSIQELYFKTSLNQFVIGTLLFLLIWLNVDFLFNIIPNSEKFIEGKYVVLFIAFGRLADMVTGVNTEIILNSSYYKFNFFLIVTSAFLLIVLNYFLISLLGMNGAALSVLIIIVLFNIIKCLFLYIQFKIHPFAFQTLLIFIFGVISFLCVNFLPSIESGIFTPYFNIALRSFIVLVTFVGPVLYFNVSEDLNAVVRRVLNRDKV